MCFTSQFLHVTCVMNSCVFDIYLSIYLYISACNKIDHHVQWMSNTFSIITLFQIITSHWRSTQISPVFQLCLNPDRNHWSHIYNQIFNSQNQQEAREDNLLCQRDPHTFFKRWRQLLCTFPQLIHSLYSLEPINVWHLVLATMCQP